MSVQEYSLHYDSLARYAPSIVATMQDRIHRFIAGLAPKLTESCATAALQDSMDISWIQAFTQHIEKGKHRQQGKFVIVPEILSDPFAVSTPVGESIIARWVYRGYTVTVCSRQTSADLLELDMMDFDAIMGMEWVAACDAIVYCRAKAAIFHFLDELPRIPLEREIDFSIDLLPRTQSISIPPYRMAPAELNKLKEQLKDLSEKDFIRPSTSP
ncbi:uncharacterized protein [Nicotiana tomentosiformis]|uniref:uncharacterized protein n=1 Tax=Nicotiana tomentosiformis TaxID=4098 RepID=UPI00388C46B3